MKATNNLNYDLKEEIQEMTHKMSKLQAFYVEKNEVQVKTKS